MIDQDFPVIDSQDCIRIPHINDQQHITPFSPAKPVEIQISKFTRSDEPKVNQCQMKVKFQNKNFLTFELWI
jgi:hypothetical protein